MISSLLDLAAMSAADAGERSSDSLSPGTRAEVQSKLTGEWSPGFMVERVDEHGYVLRRRSDDQLLPGQFGFEVVRRERRSMWWM